MKKYIFTFGSGQLPWVRERGINVMKVMLVVEAEGEHLARDIVINSKIGIRFCTSYEYDKYAQYFKDEYKMIEYSLNDIV